MINSKQFRKNVNHTNCGFKRFSIKWMTEKIHPNEFFNRGHMKSLIASCIKRYTVLCPHRLLTVSHHRFLREACEKVGSDWRLAGGFPWLLRFPPPVPTGLSRQSLKMTAPGGQDWNLTICPEWIPNGEPCENPQFWMAECLFSVFFYGWMLTGMIQFSVWISKNW